MTEPAVDLLDAGVHAVAEVNRLNRTDPLMRRKIIEIEEPGEKANYDAKENKSPERSIFFTHQFFHDGSQIGAKRIGQSGILYEIIPQ